MNTNQKFTATLVNEADKAIVVKMRDETGLGEKQLMQLVIATAYANFDTIKAAAAEIVKAEVAERENRRKENYELLKQKMKEAREAAKAERTKRSTKTTEQVEQTA